MAQGRTAEFERLEKLITAEYDERLDKLLLVKGIWEATKDAFTDATTQSKVNTALNRAFPPALDKCLMDRRPLDDLERVQDFIKAWLDDSMRRAWSAVEFPEKNNH